MIRNQRADLIWRLVGRRVTLVYLGTVGLSAVVGGLLLDSLLPEFGSTLQAVAGHDHEAAGGVIGHLWGAVLVAVLLLSLARWPGRGRKEEAVTTGQARPRQVMLSVTGMTCSHCAAAVRRALAECPGVRRAEVDLDRGTAVVDGDEGFDPAACVVAVNELGYKAEIVGD